MVTITKTEERYPGFRVRLYSVPCPARDATEENRRWAAWEDLAEALDNLDTLVKFMDFDTVRYHGCSNYGQDGAKALAELEEYREAYPGKGLDTKAPLAIVDETIPFARRVENDLYEGVLWPQACGWNKADNAPVLGLHYYAQRRVVQSRDYANVAGWLHLKSGAVNLRAPDRKDFIEDDKYEKLVTAYTDEARLLLVDMATVATDAEMEAFDSALRYILKDDDVLSLIPYLFGKGIDPVTGRRTELQGGELRSILPRKVDPKAEAAEDERFAGTHMLPNVIPEPRQHRERYELPSPAVWVEASEVDRYEANLAVARDAGLPIVVGKSGMQRRALQIKTTKDPQFLHVKDLGGKLTVEADVKAVKMKMHEAKELLPVLERLAHAVGAERVKVGHLTFRRVLAVGEARFPMPVRDGSLILGMNVGEVIYVDASYALGVVREAMQRAYPQGYIFFRLLSTVAHERAHQLTPAPDGTPEHLGKIEEVMHSAHDWIAENL